MPTTVIDNIKGRELPADWQRRAKASPDESYSISIRPQKECAALREIVKTMRENAERRGLTPEILADALDVDVETVR
ncbi:MAG: hypothetical protein V3R70_05245 [Syntrophobacteria bacterium]